MRTFSRAAWSSVEEITSTMTLTVLSRLVTTVEPSRLTSTSGKSLQIFTDVITCCGWEGEMGGSMVSSVDCSGLR